MLFSNEPPETWIETRRKAMRAWMQHQGETGGDMGRHGGWGGQGGGWGGQGNGGQRDGGQGEAGQGGWGAPPDQPGDQGQ